MEVGQVNHINHSYGVAAVVIVVELLQALADDPQ